MLSSKRFIELLKSTEISFTTVSKLSKVPILDGDWRRIANTEGQAGA